jgi:hypothetical protein
MQPQQQQAALRILYQVDIESTNLLVTVASLFKINT